MEARLGSHRHGTHGWWLVVAAALFLVLILMQETSPAAGAARQPCRVRDTSSGSAYKALQTAVNAAGSGDRLAVKGTCVGTTVIGKDLVIEGVESRTMGKPRLSALRKSRVIMVAKGAKVKLLSLQVVRGDGAGCLRIRGNLVLRDVIVRHCGPVSGCCGVGGAHNYGKLTLNGTSLITRSGPAGVFNEGTLILNGRSSINGNGTEYDAAGVFNLGNLVMNGSSSISYNHGQYTGGVDNYGALTMNDSSSIEGNGSSGEFGHSAGGVNNAVIGPRRWHGLRRVHRGSLTMNDTSSIRGNDSHGIGGGLRNAGGDVAMNDTSSISGNTAFEGGGVAFLKGRFTMDDASSISGNTANWRGGGVYLGGGRFFMNDTSTISRNVAPEVGEGTNEEGDVVGGGGGGGLFLLRGAPHGVHCGPAETANVYRNTPDDCYSE